jgi:amino acid transporter
VAEAHDQEESRLGLWHLFALALGPVVGSGWLLAPAAAGMPTGWYALLPWLIGGAVMAVTAVVMVELGRRVPQTGGLIRWPHDSSGRYVATITAAALWVFYAVNPVTEAAAVTRGLSAWCGGLYGRDGPTLEGFVLTAVFLALITAVNVAAPRWFLRVNLVITVIKVAVPILVVIALFASSWHRSVVVAGGHPLPAGSEISRAVSAITGAGVIYAYVGFQAPLDFAGQIRRDGRGETARLRWSVFGTVAGSVLLYTALEAVFLRHAGWQPGNPDSPYTQFALAASLGWAAWFIKPDALLSPAGAGMVFSFALTREVDALSRAHLVHAGLRDPESRRRIGSYDVFWVILVVDMVIGLLALAAFSGSWQSLTAAMAVPTLLVYAMPAVSLVTFGRARGAAEAEFRLSAAETGLAWLTFMLIAMAVYGAGWGTVWPGMATLGTGVLILLLPPFLKGHSRLGLLAPLRGYNAQAAEDLIVDLRSRRSDPDVRGGLTLVAYLVVLSLLALGQHRMGPWGLIPVCAASLFFFRRLTSHSTDYYGPGRTPAGGSPAEDRGEPFQAGGAQGDPDAAAPTV